jgi:dihydropteroate synthase
MARYSIRRLHLTSRNDLLAELGEEHGGSAEFFIEQTRRHVWPLKVIARGTSIPPQLSVAFTERDISFWQPSAAEFYVFTDPYRLADLCRTSSFINEEEESLAAELRRFLDRHERDRFVIHTPRQILELGHKTAVMGVLNCTPDSFSDGGRYFEKQAAIEHALRMVEAGADMIDVGGESTRPAGTYGEGARPVSEDEEIDRVVPVIEALARLTPAMLSIDTCKSTVAKAAIEAGADLVNDISGFQFDSQMPAVVAQRQVAVVVMHIKGTPRDMQQNPSYKNLMDELYQYFEERLEVAHHAGVSADQIILDPGLGFGKRLQDNYEILRRLEEFRGLGCPVLVGPSRKSFIGKVLDTPVDERVEGTAAAVALSIANGAHLVRVHDVKEIYRVAKISDMIVGRSGEAGARNRQ